MTATKSTNPYERRKNTLTQQDKISLKWAMEKENPTAKVSDQRKQFWDQMHAAIRNSGGSVTSIPYLSPMIIELPVEKSMVAEKLPQLGYTLVDKGNQLRTCHTGHTTSRVFELILPK